MIETETLVIKYKAQKEHIEEVKKASADWGGSLEDFVHYCINKYLHNFWWHRKIDIQKNLFKKLAKRSRELDLTVEDYVDQLVRNAIVKGEQT